MTVKDKYSSVKVQFCGQDLKLEYCHGDYTAEKYDAEHDRLFVMYKWGEEYHVQENLKDGNIADVGDYPDYVSALIALGGAGLHGRTYPVEDMNPYQNAA